MARRVEPGASALWQGSYRRYNFPDTAKIGLGTLGQIVQADQEVDFDGTEARRKEPNATTQARLVAGLPLTMTRQSW
jgi:hypothetical protein